MGWTREELLHAQRSGQRLDVIAPGLGGCEVVSVRDADVLVKTPFPGSAYVGFSSIRSPPPTRFSAGARVSTPYGRGVVVELRSSCTDVSYVVQFVDKGATGYLRPDDIKERDHLLLDEAISDAEALRAKGNAAFKASDFHGAIRCYEEVPAVLDCLQPTPYIEPAGLAAVKEQMVKALGNASQAYLFLASGGTSPTHAATVLPGGVTLGGALAAGVTPHLRVAMGQLGLDDGASADMMARAYFTMVVQYASDALDINDGAPSGDKLRYRRGVARTALGDYKGAVEDLGGLTDPPAVAKLREAQAGLREANRAAAFGGGRSATATPKRRGDGPPPPRKGEEVAPPVPSSPGPVSPPPPPPPPTAATHGCASPTSAAGDVTAHAHAPITPHRDEEEGKEGAEEAAPAPSPAATPTKTVTLSDATLEYAPPAVPQSPAPEEGAGLPLTPAAEGAGSSSSSSISAGGDSDAPTSGGDAHETGEAQCGGDSVARSTPHQPSPSSRGPPPEGGLDASTRFVGSTPHPRSTRLGASLGLSTLPSPPHEEGEGAAPAVTAAGGGGGVDDGSVPAAAPSVVDDVLAARGSGLLLELEGAAANRAVVQKEGSSSSSSSNASEVPGRVGSSSSSGGTEHPRAGDAEEEGTATAVMTQDESGTSNMGTYLAIGAVVLGVAAVGAMVYMRRR